MTKKIKKPLSYEDALRQIELFRIMYICEIDYDLVVSAIRIQKQSKVGYRSLFNMKRTYWPTEQWKTVKPEAAGLDPGKLASL